MTASNSCSPADGGFAVLRRYTPEEVAEARRSRKRVGRWLPMPPAVFPGEQAWAWVEEPAPDAEVRDGDEQPTSSPPLIPRRHPLPKHGQPAIRLLDYMGDEDEDRMVFLIGPYPDTVARDADLYRLSHLPLGGDEYNGGYQFEAATMAEAVPSRLDGHTVSPEQVVGVTSIRAFYAAFYGLDDEPEGAAAAELPGQLGLLDEEVVAGG